MDCCERIYFITTLACAIKETVPPEDLALLAALLNQLGDTLVAIDVCQQKSEQCKKEGMK